MKAWLQLISIGMVGAMVASACVIVDDDDDDDDNNGEAGDTSTGGRATGGRPGTGGTTGGRATGGTSTGGTSTGGTATGGINGGGGEGGTTPDSCEEESTPFGSCEFFVDGNADPCEECLADNCCDEVSACFGTEPEDVCGYPVLEGEFECARSCLAEIVADGEIPSDDDIDDCIGECMKCTLPSPNTGPLVICMDTSCSEACY
jgi:hypothetical protein